MKTRELWVTALMAGSYAQGYIIATYSPSLWLVAIGGTILGIGLGHYLAREDSHNRWWLQ